MDHRSPRSVEFDTAIIMVGEISFDGELKLGHNVQIGYFAQNQSEYLDGELTLIITFEPSKQALRKTVLCGSLYLMALSSRFTTACSRSVRSKLAKNGNPEPVNVYCELKIITCMGIEMSLS